MQETIDGIELTLKGKVYTATIDGYRFAITIWEDGTATASALDIDLFGFQASRSSFADIVKACQTRVQYLMNEIEYDRIAYLAQEAHGG